MSKPNRSGTCNYQFGNVHATIKTDEKKYPKGIFEFFSSETPRLKLDRSHVHISKFKYSHGFFLVQLTFR